MNTTSKTPFLVAPLYATLVLGASLCRPVNAQCYIDPFTGRQVCTQPMYGWRSASVPYARPQSERNSPLAAESPQSSNAHCRITVGDGSTGSGTLVARDDAIGLVLTCAHLFDDSTGRIVVTFPSGRRFAARLLDRDNAHDLAALAIRRPDVEPITPTDSAPEGTLYTCGFGPAGEFRCLRGEITGQATAAGATYPSFTIRGAARPGDSGGGVLNAAGQLVGVVWGQRDGETYAMCGRPVREFLDRVLNDRAARKNQIAAETRPSKSPAPQIDWQAWTSEIESRIRQLDDKKQDKGDYLQPGDLNGYVRDADVPAFDETQFARRAELQSRLETLSKHFDVVKRHTESFEQRLKRAAAIRVGIFEGLSIAKLLLGTLGLSGPLAAAVIVVGGFARAKSRVKSEESRAKSGQSRADCDLALDSRPSALDSKPIAVDSPPPAQRTLRETHYVPVEKDSFAKAHQWASEHVARKYPGAAEVLQAQDSLIKQFLNAQ
jgi:hypothetical protein